LCVRERGAGKEAAANIGRCFDAAVAAGTDGRFAEPALRLLGALPQLRDVGAAYVGPAPVALPLVDFGAERGEAAARAGHGAARASVGKARYSKARPCARCSLRMTPALRASLA